MFAAQDQVNQKRALSLDARIRFGPGSRYARNVETATLLVKVITIATLLALAAGFAWRIL